MAQGPKPRPSERYSALALVLVLHAAGLILLLSQRDSLAAPPIEPGSLKVVALNADAPRQAPPPPPVLPSKLIQEIRAEMQLAISTTERSDAAAASAGGCVALEQVRTAIMSDPAALGSTVNAPPETRSIAQAVVIWNETWASAASSTDAPLGPTRAAVERSLAALTEECLDEPIAGPRLIPFPAGAGTVFLVFGSGDWTWRDVAQPIEQIPDEAGRVPQSTANTLRALLNRLQGN